MAWSIFTQGGGKSAAEQWSVDLLTALGAPITPGNVQFVYDWELIERGGGKYNPLNQGPVPGQPQLTTTGQQYGGGAADYASYQAGIQGAVDFLHMPNYIGIDQALLANNPSLARAKLVASPWASGHYGGGANFPNTPLPFPIPGAGPLPAPVPIPGVGVLPGSGAAPAPIPGTAPTPTDLATLLASPVGGNTSLSPIGTVLKYLDAFLNPHVSAIPGWADIFGTNAILKAIFTIVDRIIIVSIGTAMIATGIFVMVRSTGASPVETVLSAARAGTGVGNVVLRGKEFGLKQDQQALARQREARIGAGGGRRPKPGVFSFPEPEPYSKVFPTTPKRSPGPPAELAPVPDDIIDAEWFDVDVDAPALNR